MDKQRPEISDTFVDADGLCYHYFPVGEDDWNCGYISGVMLFDDEFVLVFTIEL